MDKHEDSIPSDIDNAVAEALKSVERNTTTARPAGAPPDATEGGAGAPAQPAQSAAAEASDALRAELGRARSELREKEAELEASQALGRETMEKLKDQHERLLRAAADLDNYKKRAARERDEVLKYGLEKLLRELLPVVDNLDRALDHAHSPADFDGLRQGILMTRRLFEETLAKVGVTAFSAIDSEFDPHRHEAMQAVESDAAAGTVVAEYARGFMLNDRLMRPAMVVVAKPRSAPEPAAATAAVAQAVGGAAVPVSPETARFGDPASDAADAPPAETTPANGTRSTTQG